MTKLDTMDSIVAAPASREAIDHEIKPFRVQVSDSALADLRRRLAATRWPFPDGTVIARLAWSYDRSELNNRVFGRQQSFVAGHPKNGVQFMVWI